MELDIGRVVAVLLVGGLAGSLIGRLMKGRKAGFGIWKNLALGVGGAVIGTFLFGILGVDFGLDNLKITFNDLVASLLGSLLLLLIVWFVQRGKKKPADGG
jgi:uncharacterized membrane protein YeaQ/YmgE (transglycosylase-associated protein family)